MIGLGVLLAVVLVWRLSNRPPQPPKISQDPLSTGIAERWGAALPDGFTKRSVEHMGEESGFIFARLTFEEDVGELLARWEAAGSDLQARFDAVLDAQLADPATTPEDAALITENRPTLGEGWVWFSITADEDERDMILLAYHAATKEMFLAEQRVA